MGLCAGPALVSQLGPEPVTPSGLTFWGHVPGLPLCLWFTEMALHRHRHCLNSPQPSRPAQNLPGSLGEGS